MGAWGGRGGGHISLANPNSPLSITSAPAPGGGWQRGWQGPPGWPGTANALTHDTHVPARGKAIGGERGCRSPKYPGVPDTGDYRFTDGTIAQPGLSRLPAKHQNSPKPLPPPFPLPPHANHPTAESSCRVPATPAGPLVSFPAGFSPNWGFFQSVEAKCVVQGLSGFEGLEMGGSARAWLYFPSKGVKGKKKQHHTQGGCKNKIIIIIIKMTHR